MFSYNFPPPASERFWKKPLKSGLLRGTVEKRLRNAWGEIVNDHVRAYFISNAYGEAIPHGAMPGKNYPQALLRRFSQCPGSHIPARRKRLEATSTRKATIKKQFTRN
jgi:hypothetical protein